MSCADTCTHTCRVVFESMVDAEGRLCPDADEVRHAVEDFDLGGAWVNVSDD